MWTPLSTFIYPHTTRLRIEQNSRPITFADVLRLWRTEAPFCFFFSQALAHCPYTAFRWECPPLTRAGVTRPFECVLVESPSLAREPDIQTFRDRFTTGPNGVVTFANLGSDAVLVVPCPAAPPAAYTHLAAFLRGAPDAQQQALWQTVANTLETQLGDKPIWLNTAGGGVAWLHVRLDTRPKYYSHAPYKIP